jgi:hypothetical protein
MRLCNCISSFVNDLSELFQHEYDRLEGIMNAMKTTDNKSFRWILIKCFWKLKIFINFPKSKQF